jgi:hypothetical protein
MLMRASVFFVLLLPSIQLSGQSAPSQPRAVVDCRDWTECRRLALEAAERREYETFHDLAWRAVQIGPRQDRALMFLLARAQALSGRPHDALIMIQRLAEMGVAPDVATSEDFERVRALPDWPAVSALIERVRGVGGSTADVPPAAEKLAAVSAARERPAVEQAVRISTPGFAASGLAYDAVSGRFVIGDRRGRKLIIVQDGADHAVDLVGPESAGFHEIRALEIDTRQGDLWVATATPDDQRWSLHRLQLVSGRPLKVLPIDPALGAMRLVDLAVTPLGSVVALDAAGNRLLELMPKAIDLRPVLALDIDQPTSLAVAGDGLIYVAGAKGLQRIDLRNRTAANISVPGGLESARVERIRCYGNALLSVVRDAGGARRVVRLDLNAAGRAVTAATLVDASIPQGPGSIFTTISGDYLSYVVSDAESATGGASDGTQRRGPAELIVRRVRLR